MKATVSVKDRPRVRAPSPSILTATVLLKENPRRFNLLCHQTVKPVLAKMLNKVCANDTFVTLKGFGAYSQCSRCL
jgi:hypothetical protein